MKTSFLTHCLLLLASIAIVGITVGCDKSENEPQLPVQEETEDDGKIGYWVHDKFIEFQIADPNVFLVQARYIDNPVSQEELPEILTSLGVKNIFANDYNKRYYVEAETRPQHPGLFVTPQFKTSTSDWLFIVPEITLSLVTEESLDAILQKYGKHLTEQDNSPSHGMHRFNCDFATSEEVLRLAAKIHQEPTVNWCTANMIAPIIFD